MQQFTFHHDNGHGWIECPMSVLKELDIDEWISGSSYINEGRVYLEEDMDGALFYEAYRVKKNKRPCLLDKFHQVPGCFIRNFNRFPAKAGLNDFRRQYSKLCELRR